MAKGFWRKLKKPIFALAPMADVTDQAFRLVILKYGKPDVFWTEFVSADGLCSQGINKLLPYLKFSKKEKPIIAQIFGANPENIKKAATLIEELGFDGVDINMGCPDRKIEKQGAGAALIKTPKLAQEIILAAKGGVKNIPVSVKTRVGYNTDNLEDWLKSLLEVAPDLITIHARTRKEMSLVPANWKYIERAVKIRNKLKSKTLIFGNGDIKDANDAYLKLTETGADGVMFGRAIFGNPWLFNSRKKIVTKKDKIVALLDHLNYFKKYCSHKNYAVMKKHFKAYISGWNGAKELRINLMKTSSVAEAVKILKVS